MRRALPAWQWLAWLALCLLAIIPGAARAQAPAAGPYTHPQSQLVFPQAMGGMPRQMVRDYEPMRAGLGVGIKYGMDEPRVLADIYIFNQERAVIPEGTGDVLVQAMFDAAIGDIRQMGEAGRYRNVSFLGSDIVPLGEAAGVRSALRARFSFSIDGQEVFSHVYGLAVHNHFVKLRFTYMRDQAEQAVPVLGAMLTDLGRVVGSNAQ
jgi:hypothetical protein